VTAQIKTCPEDFIVEEIPAYEPSGDGAHLYVTFTKRDLTTDAVVAAIARAGRVKPRDVGVPGMKDKVAITTQTISLPWREGLEGEMLALTIPGVTIASAKRHNNKLKTGHLHGNRFRVRISNIDREEGDRIVGVLERIKLEGVPNAFGAQRFGRAGDNAVRAKAWLTGKEPLSGGPFPRDPRQLRFLFSALQSAVFNEVLARRVQAGTWATVAAGDLVKRRDSGGLFLCTDEQQDRERAARGEVSATGPIPGVKMRPAEGAPGALEREVFQQIVGDEVDFAKTARLGEGTRRVLRLWVEELTVSREQDDDIWVYFVLPKGAYATTVIAAACETGERDDGDPTPTEEPNR
jgi:tRNA pseudouridine13 synthase